MFGQLAPLVLFVLTHTTPFNEQHTPNLIPKSIPQQEVGRSSFIASCRRLNYRQLGTYIRNLGKQKRFQELEAIYRSDLPLTDYAITIAMEAVNDVKEALNMYKKIPYESDCWPGALIGLSLYSKQNVIQEFIKAASSTNPRVRFFCYARCRSLGWPELLTYAKKDITSNIKVFVPNSLIYTLGQQAQSYIQHLKAKR